MVNFAYCSAYMKVLFIARPTLYTDAGGDTVQIMNTAKFLRELGVEVDVVLSNQKNINYTNYHLLHVFNVIDCEDLLGHVIKCKIPYVLSTIYVDYSEYDRNHRKGMVGVLSKILSSGQVEYLKTVAKYILKGEKVSTFWYFVIGHKRSIKYLLKHAACLLPNSNSEYRRLVNDFGIQKKYYPIVNAIDTTLFHHTHSDAKINNQVICIARIEGRKNQLNLIKSAKGKPWNLTIIGKASSNQQGYVKQCHQEATTNTSFVGPLTQQELVMHYSKAKVHVLPSWFETTGLSTLEAAAMGCNVVIADKGDVREYFGDLAYYCEPASPTSIANAITRALEAPVNPALQMHVLQNYTWQKAAKQTLAAYKMVLNND